MSWTTARIIRLTSAQTIRDIGVLRNQIGNEGLSAVIEFLPGQYTKRTLNSKTARANYVTTVLADPQRPFIWEFFRPGTIPLAGEHVFYDEVCLTGLITKQS
jgi:hypothetical protein